MYILCTYQHIHEWHTSYIIVSISHKLISVIMQQYSDDIMHQLIIWHAWIAIIGISNSHKSSTDQIPEFALYEKNKNSITDFFSVRMHWILKRFEFCIEWDQITFMCNGFDILTLTKFMILFLIFFARLVSSLWLC